MSQLIQNHVFIPIVPNWVKPPRLTRRWDNKIISKAKRDESRASMRGRPLLTLELNITSENIPETVELEGELRAAMKIGRVAVPFHGRGIRLASDTSGVTVQLVDNLWTWKDGAAIAFYDGEGLAEIGIVYSVSGNTLTMAYPPSRIFKADHTTAWPLFYGRPSVPNGFDPITTRAGDMKLVVTQFEPFASDYVKRPDPATGGSVEEPIDISNIPIGWTDDQALEAPYSELDAYQGTSQQFVPTLWYGPSYYTDNDPNTMTEARKQFLIDALLWEFENYKRTSGKVIGGHSGITWQSANFGLFYSAESARTDLSVMDPATFPAGISQFNPGAFQAYTLVLYYDELAPTGGTIESELPFDPEEPPSEPPALFSTYENRPLLPDACDNNLRPKTFSFDLRQLDIGFNASSINPLQEHVIHGLETDRFLLSEFDIVRDDFFFQDLVGSAGTFWYPAPFEEAEISAAISTTQFKVSDRDFATEFNDQPAQYLEVRYKDGTTPHYSKISGVADNGDGTETVTLTTAAPQAPAVGDVVRTLHLVRLAGNEERIEFLDEQKARRRIRMVEVPYEYGVTVTAPKKVYLYRFTCNGTSWHYTSFEENIGSTFDGAFDFVNFQPAPINHGSIKKSIRAEREEVQIQAVIGEVAPLDLWVPFTISLPMSVEIFETTEAAPTTGRVLFLGRIQSVAVEGRKLTAKASSVLDTLADSVPKFMIGPRCNHHLFSVGCGANKATYAETRAISAISGIQVTITGSAITTNDYYAFGWFEALSDHNKEVRSILKSTHQGGGAHKLWLNLPLNRTTTSDNCTIYPGCDGLYATCNTKFSNTDNFGGHPYVPQNNLTIKALNIPSGGTGKK